MSIVGCMSVARRLWSDTAGFTVSMELVLVATITVIGLVVGLASYRDALVQEFGDTAAAVGQLDQSYRYNSFGIILDANDGFTYVTVNTAVAGSTYQDNTDLCDGQDVANQPPAGIEIGPPNAGPINEGQPLPSP